MREARLIVPTTGNNGEDLSDVHNYIRRTLADHFGGFTVTPGQGAYRMKSGALKSEAVRVYDVAAIDTKRNREVLQAIARTVALDASQESIYLRDFDGRVDLITGPASVPRYRAANDNKSVEFG